MHRLNHSVLTNVVSFLFRRIFMSASDLDVDSDITHSQSSARVVRTTMTAYGEWENLTPITHKPLSRSSPKFAGVITSGIHTACKILSRWDKGFRFCTCVTSRPLGDSAIFFVFFRFSKPIFRQIRQTTQIRPRMCLLGVSNP